MSPPGATTNIPSLALSSLLPDNTREFYRYKGSLTTPACNEVVIWTLFRHKVKISSSQVSPAHDDVIKWKQFPRYWPFVRGIHRSTVNSPPKSQRRAVLMFSLICAWINGWVNSGEAGDLRRRHAHYDVTVIFKHDGVIPDMEQLSVSWAICKAHHVVHSDQCRMIRENITEIINVQFEILYESRLPLPLPDSITFFLHITSLFPFSLMPQASSV